jgi:hypothetical protein
MNELQSIHETESENAAKGVPDTGTLERAKVARENEIPLNNKGEKAKENDMHPQENIDLFDYPQKIQSGTSKIDKKDVSGIGTPETVKVAGENVGLEKDLETKTKEQGMSDWQKLGIEKIKELQANGELRSPAEKFLDEPTIGRAVRRFCYECNGFSHQHATNCESTNCALWLFRHGKITATEDELPVWQKAHKRWLQSAGELKRE